MPVARRVKGLPKAFKLYTVDGRPGFYHRVRGGRTEGAIKAKVVEWARASKGKGLTRPRTHRFVPATDLNEAFERATGIRFPDQDGRMICDCCLRPAETSVLVGTLIACPACHQAQFAG